MTSPSSKLPALDANLCAICLDGIDNPSACEQHNKQLLNCSHVFHDHCIGEWLQRAPHPNCPLCQTDAKIITPPTPKNIPTPVVPIRASTQEAPIFAIPLKAMSAALKKALSLAPRSIKGVKDTGRLDLDENKQMSLARRVNSITRRFFDSLHFSSARVYFVTAQSFLAFRLKAALSLAKHFSSSTKFVVITNFSWKR